MPNVDAGALDDSVELPFGTYIVPLGERAVRRILDHVVAVGDEVEPTYLDV